MELVPIPGLGAKTIKRLYEEVGVESLVSLRAAIDEGNSRVFGVSAKRRWRRLKHISMRRYRLVLYCGVRADAG